MTKKRILIITPGFLPLLGGMEEQVYTLAREFLRMGIIIDVLTERTSSQFKKQEMIDGINVFRIEKPNRKSSFFIISIYRQIRKFFRIHKNYDLIVIRTFTSYGLIAGTMKFLKIIKTPTYITADTGGKNDELTPILNSKIRPLYKFLFGQHDFINSICRLNYEKYLKLGFAKSKLTRIYNGLDLSGYSKASYPNKIRDFLFIAQLKREKGIYETLEAFKGVLKEYPDSKLFVAGDGPEFEQVKKSVDQDNLSENIILLGRVSRDQRENFFSKGQCLVLPSYSEGFGLVYYEAALSKRAIVATDVADIKEIFGDQVILCQKRDANDLREKMIYAIKKFDLSRLNYDKIMDLVNIKKTASDILSLISK
jgi:glycosyltransferase involved in cell wall biosynthesis